MQQKSKLETYGNASLISGNPINLYSVGQDYNKLRLHHGEVRTEDGRSNTETNNAPGDYQGITKASETHQKR
jgi:hypothetical protein